MNRKEPSFLRLAVGLFALVPVVVLPPHAMATLPSGPQVVHGRVDYTQSGNHGLVTQHTRNAIVNWRSFDIGAAQSLRISQTGAQAAMLARVTGGDPTRILGQLQADGRLFLINERGILVGAGARIDTAAFLASTLDVSDSDFLRGNQLLFRGDSAAGIVNLGTITAREGDIHLFAHTVKNAGEINAPKGAAALAAGTEVLLASADAPDFLIKANLPATTEKTGVDNSGLIAAAQARLEASGSLYELAVNQSGVVRATGSARLPDGRVLLTADGGTVGVSGQVSARDASGSGGEILVGGDYRGQNAAVANARRTVVTATATLDASSATAKAQAGRVIVWADDSTRFLGTLAATGAGGGFAEISGKRWLDFNPAAPVRLGHNGTLLLDPDALVIGTAPDNDTSTIPGDPFTFGATDEPAFLNVATLLSQLALTHVILDTSTSTGDITFNAALDWSGIANRTLTVRSGNNIRINADITGGPGSTLALYTGSPAYHFTGGELGYPEIEGRAELAEDATIKVGTLRFGVNEFADHDGYSPPLWGGNALLFVDGKLEVDVLEADLSTAPVNIMASNPDNAIGAFRTIGNGTLDGARIVDGHGDLDVTLNTSEGEPSSLQFFTPGDLTLKAGSSVSFVENEFDPSRVGTVLFASTAGGAFVNQAGASVFGDHTRFLIYTSTRAATTRGGLVGGDVFNHPYDELDWFDDNISRFFFTEAGGMPLLTYTANNLARFFGSANPAFTYSISGWIEDIANDIAGAPALSATATQNSGVNTYTISIGLGTLTSSNYAFAFQNGTLTVNPAPLTITANNYTRRVGTDHASFSVSYDGFVLGQDASALAGTLSYATSATQSSPVGNAYTITPSGLTSGNYAITFVPGALTIADNIPLTISAIAASRLYGAANPAFTETYSGFVGNDTSAHVTGLRFTTDALQSSGVGTYVLTPYNATALGYDITFIPATLTINRAPLTIAIPNQSRVYGNANNFTVNYNGLVNNDTRSVVSGLSFDTTANIFSNVGTYAVAGTGASAANYDISFTGGLLSITPAQLTVGFAPATRLYGDANPTFTYSIGGLKNGDSGSFITVTGVTSAAVTDNIGAHAISGFVSTTVSNPNYTVPLQAFGSLTIAPRPLTITADSFTRVYGDSNQPLTATFDGLAPHHVGANPFAGIGISTPANETSGVGAWGVNLGNVSNPNYTITRVPGVITITPAPLLVDPLLELARVYGRANPDLVLPAIFGLRNDDTLAHLGLSFSTPALTADAGLYTYGLASTNPNYTITGGTGEFRVTPAPITVSIGPATRPYGDENPANYDLVVNGLAFGHTAPSVIGIVNHTSPLTNVGAYALSPTLKNANYVIESVTGGTFAITPRVLTFTAADRAKIYGDPNPIFYGSVTGFANGHTEDDIVAAQGFVTAADRHSSVGSYSIRPSAQLSSTNYVGHFVDGTLTVLPARIFITIANATRNLLGPDPSFTVADIAGLKNEDSLASLGVAFSTTANSMSAPGAYPITAAISSPNYVASIDQGVLLVGIPRDVIDMNSRLDPAKINTLFNNNTPIYKDYQPTNETVEIDKPKELTLAANPDVALHTSPLTKTDYANYLAGFAGQADAVKSAMAADYKNLLAGKGKKDSAYETMPPGARAMLEQWMNGQLSLENLRSLIAIGDMDAVSAFGFILPTLIDLTRAKDVADMTPADRQILGRLADLTEKRRSDTVRIAQLKYDQMIEENRKRAEIAGLSTLFIGPGDFQNIVQSATEESMTTAILASTGGVVGVGAAYGIMTIPAIGSKLIFINSGAAVLASSAGGFAIAAGMMVVLAVRAVQMSESIKNEADFNALMNSWKLGQEITSIEQLKGSSMDKDMNLSTLMLAAEMLSLQP